MDRSSTGLPQKTPLSPPLRKTPPMKEYKETLNRWWINKKAQVFFPTRFPTFIEGSNVLFEYCCYSLVTLCNLNLKKKQNKTKKMLFGTKTALQRWLQKHKKRKWWCLFITSMVPFSVPSLFQFWFFFPIWFSLLWFPQHQCHWPRIWMHLYCEKKINELSVINFVQASRCKT